MKRRSFLGAASGLLMPSALWAQTPTPPTNLLVEGGSVVPPPTGNAPGYFTSAIPNRWAIVPGSDVGTILAANPSLPSNACAYSGSAVSPDGKIYFTGGGHALQANNAMYILNLTGSGNRTWTRFNAGSNATSGDFAWNGTGAYSDGSRASDHNYSMMVAVGGGTVYFGGIGSGWAPAGGTFSSTAVWKWREADVGNGRHGYTYVGLAKSGAFTGMAMVESVACWDEANHRVFVVTQNGFQQPAPIWSIDTHNDAITVWDAYSGYTEYPAWCTVVPRLNSLLVGTQQNTLKRMNLSTGAWSNCTLAGTGITSRTCHAAYSPAADQVIGRLNGDGTAVRALTLPATASGTYTWIVSNGSTGGVNPGDSLAATDSGPYSRVNLIANFGGSGHDLLTYVKGGNEPTYFQRITGPRS
jgi:hypothetical protein